MHQAAGGIHKKTMHVCNPAQSYLIYLSAPLFTVRSLYTISCIKCVLMTVSIVKQPQEIRCVCRQDQINQC